MKLSKEMDKRLCELTDFMEKKESSTLYTYCFKQTDLYYEIVVSKDLFIAENEIDTFPISMHSTAGFNPDWLEHLEKEVNDDFFQTNRVFLLTKNCRRPLRNCSYYFSIEKDIYKFYRNFLLVEGTSLHSIPLKYESYVDEFFKLLEKERYKPSIHQRKKDRILIEIK